ncbi:MAG: Hsp20/alpha crystallin family protein [Gammaproteobacteria bacterium]|nr:Hsp20/alpha crystallin family protein [Gammaproteobacteria bacterium]
MQINLYDPWQLVSRLQQDANRALSARTDGSRQWVPAVDILEEPDKFVIRADVPGVESKDLDITMEKGVLTIRGSREVRAGDAAETYRRSERISGSFVRRFSLPQAADAEAVSADYRNGVLTVTIPKQAAAQPRRIEVN